MPETISVRCDEHGNLLDGQALSEEMAEILDVIGIVLEAERIADGGRPRIAPAPAPPLAQTREAAYRRRCFAVLDTYVSQQESWWPLRTHIHHADRAITGLTVHVRGEDAMQTMALRHGNALFSVLLLTLARHHREQAYSLYHALLSLGVLPQAAAWNAHQFCAGLRREAGGEWTFRSQGQWARLADASTEPAIAIDTYARKVLQSSQRAPDAPKSIGGGPHPRELGPHVVIARVEKDDSGKKVYPIKESGFGPAERLVVETPRGVSEIASQNMATEEGLSLDVSGPAATGGDTVDAVLSAYGTSIVERDAARWRLGKRGDELASRILYIAGACPYSDNARAKLAHVIRWRDDETLMPSKLLHARLYAVVRAIQYVSAESP